MLGSFHILIINAGSSGIFLSIRIVKTKIIYTYSISNCRVNTKCNILHLKLSHSHVWQKLVRILKLRHAKNILKMFQITVSNLKGLITVLKFGRSAKSSYWWWNSPSLHLTFTWAMPKIGSTGQSFFCKQAWSFT